MSNRRFSYYDAREILISKRNVPLEVFWDIMWYLQPTQRPWLQELGGKYRVYGDYKEYYTQEVIEQFKTIYRTYPSFNTLNGKQNINVMIYSLCFPQRKYQLVKPSELKDHDANRSKASYHHVTISRAMNSLKDTTGTQEITFTRSQTGRRRIYM